MPEDHPLRLESVRRRPPAAVSRVAGVRITHPDRLLWPDLGITKLELARYYATVAPWLLPHLRNRPMTVVRCPGAIDGHCFFQRHLNGTWPHGVGQFARTDKAKTKSNLFVSTLEGTLGLVQRGVVEMHTWGSALPRVDAPDRLTIDLDPDPDLAWPPVAEAAHLVRSLIENFNLPCFLKTTGGKGLHVVVPLERRHSWADVKAFAEGVASHFARLHPDRFTASVAKEQRTGKILIDYLRNTEAATTVSAYSARARADAPVSTPIDWDELAFDVRGAHFNVRNVPERLRHRRADPWLNYDRSAGRLTAPMRRALGVSCERSRRRRA